MTPHPDRRRVQIPSALVANSLTELLHDKEVSIKMDEQVTKRIRDENREQQGRKKRKSDAGEQMKVRNEKRKLQETPLVTGCIRFYVKSEEEKVAVYNKMDKIKLCLAEKVSSVTNEQLLNNVFDFFIQMHGLMENDSQPPKLNFQPYLPCDKSTTDEDLFITSYTAMRNICSGIQHHSQNCQELLDIKKLQKFGHTAKMTFTCKENHLISADSSQHLPGGLFLVNLRMMHSVYATGLRYSQYKRFCEAGNIGIIPESAFESQHDAYCSTTKDMAEESITEAINEEVATEILNSEENGSQYHGINIMTDARHGWRRNAAQSDIVALGQIHHRVVGLEVVTRRDDPVSQRHEMKGVELLYKHFDEKDVSVHIHGHDRNASVNKFLSVNKPYVTNANDTWHASKNVNKEMKKIATGPLKYRGITWHPDLSDKVASIKTHTYYAMKNCQGSSKKLRELLDNIVEHYKNNHQNCSTESRCRCDPNYEPSKFVIKDSDAERILQNEIRQLQIYKTPEDYVNCIDTHYVESFNNALLIYHDKRIKFGDAEYKRRSHMAILDWNENVDRQYTSVSNYEDARRPRARSGHKNLVPKTNKFTFVLWDKVVSSFYQK